MVKKLILSLSLISITAPVHGMWSAVYYNNKEMVELFQRLNIN